MPLTENQLRAVVIAGAVGGLASAVPPVSLGNCLCCLWAWTTGAIAVWLVRRKEPLPEQQAPRLGGFAGAYAGLVSAVLTLIGDLLFGPGPGLDTTWFRQYWPGEVSEESLRLVERTLEGGMIGPLGRLLTALLTMALFALFGAVGAALWSRFTRPAASPAPAQPPPAAPQADGISEPD